MTLLVPSASVDRIQKLLTEKTNGKADILPGDTLYYGSADGEVILFDA
jgi:hypothetical protein